MNYPQALPAPALRRTNQAPGEPAGCAPLCKRCVLYARAHHIPLPEEKPDENL